jgi:ankyrin repeat protein
MPISNWIIAALAGLLFMSAPALAGPLHDAAKSGDATAVGKLLAAGADVNEMDAGFNTALHWAADKGHLAVIRVLAAKGADLNARDISDDTPLQRAVPSKNAAAVQFLIAKGAKVNLLANDGIRALDTATRYGLSDIIAMLKNAGAKCGMNDSYSRKCKEAEGQN